MYQKYDLFIKVPDDGYWFDGIQIPKLEQHYDSRYIGFWCIKNRVGNWSDVPVDVFFNPNADESKGESKCFGLYLQNDEVMVCDANSAFSEPIIGILCEEDEVIVSRYRTHCAVKGDASIEGGRDNMKMFSDGNKLVSVTIDSEGFFEFSPVDGVESTNVS